MFRICEEDRFENVKYLSVCTSESVFKTAIMDLYTACGLGLVEFVKTEIKRYVGTRAGLIDCSDCLLDLAYRPRC